MNGPKFTKLLWTKRHALPLSKLDGEDFVREKTNDNNRFTENVYTFPRKFALNNGMNNNSNEQIHGNGTDNEQFMIIVCSPNVPNGKGLHCYSHFTFTMAKAFGYDGTMLV